MVKSKKTAKTYPFTTPVAPWIYINDLTPYSNATRDLMGLLPDSFLVSAFYSKDRLEYEQAPSTKATCVNVIRDTRNYEDVSIKKAAIQVVKKGALQAGANFVCVNVYNDMFQLLSAAENPDLTTAPCLTALATSNTGDKIYKWLFTVLTVCETLHLISDTKMQEIDTKLFPEYKYCTINDSRSTPKDTKVQFVALIVTKPQVMKGKRLVWTVADKTGAANFYFQHRGEGSQYTWDWVMNLKPGDRKALPRMPMVQTKERRRVRVVKTPFRAVGALIGGTGFVVKQVGRGISNVGKAFKMGSSSEWVPQADVDADGKKIDWAQKERDEANVDQKVVKKSVKVIDEKSEKLWDDGASDASTEAETEISAEKFRDFL